MRHLSAHALATWYMVVNKLTLMTSGPFGESPGKIPLYTHNKYTLMHAMHCMQRHHGSRTAVVDTFGASL